MAVRTPVVIVAGQLQQLQSGDSIPGGGTPADFALSKHVASSAFTVTAGYSASVVRYLEIASTITFEIGADADMEIT